MVGWIMVAPTHLFSQVNIVSDANWKVSDSFTAGWETEGFNDASWAFATDPSPFGCTPVIDGTETIWWSQQETGIDLYFRKTFNLSGTVTYATAEIAVDDSFYLYVNGNFVGADFWVNGFKTYEIQSYLHSGQNVIAIDGEDVYGACAQLTFKALSCNAPSTFYADADGDGYGNNDVTTVSCFVPIGYVSDNNDCNDGNGSVNPAATEVCNSSDDNCNGQVDEGITLTWYQDADGDGYGNNDVSTNAGCIAPIGYVSGNSDCNDANAAVHSGVTEICNGIDDDCNGATDDIYAYVNPGGTVTICSSSSVTLTANGGAGAYQWIKGNTNISGATNQTYVAKKAANYKVKETGYGCNATSAATTLVVNPAPTATITPQGNLDICATGSVVLQANSGSGYTYQWQKGNTLLTGQTDQTYTATKKATYKVIVTNNYSCSKTSGGVKVTKSCKEADPLENESAMFNFYPNPAGGKFTLDLKLTSEVNETATITILNLLGQIVFSQQEVLSNGELQTEMTMSNQLPSGNYLVNIAAGDKLFSAMILLEK